MYHIVVKKIKYIAHRLKLILSILRIYPDYVKASFSQVRMSINNGDKRILFTFEDRLFQENDNNGREPYHIMKAFSDGGYDVYFYRHSDFRNYYRLQLCGRLIYTIKNLKFVSRLPENTSDFIYGFDSIRPDFLSRSWKRFVYLNIRKAVTYQAGNVIPIPFGMFPLVYASGAELQIEKCRAIARKCRIFFAGNLNPIYYNSPVFKEKYPHLLTRLEGVNALTGSDLRVQFIKNAEDFTGFLRTEKYLNQFVLVQTDATFPIRPKGWLQVLGKSDFFMCFSGTDYPMCHNVIEAMSVGAIPIIEYADWFDPKLEDGKNALVYSGAQDLVKKIKVALQMPPEEIQTLRQGVLEYYDTYLAPGSLARKYEAHAQKISTLMLFPKLAAEPGQMGDGKEFSRKLEDLIMGSQIK